MCHFVEIVIIQILLTFYYQCFEKTCSCDCVKQRILFYFHRSAAHSCQPLAFRCLYDNYPKILLTLCTVGVSLFLFVHWVSLCS